MVRRLSTSDFVAKAKLIHGDLYDYTNTEYVRSGDKLEIRCRIPEHGSFWMTPSNHTHKTRPQGCPKCGRDKAGKARNKTTEEFLVEVRDIHGDRYGLHLVDYKKAKEKVILVCEEHGEFSITPTSILSKGSGCRECGIIKRSRDRSTPKPGESLFDKHPELSKEWSEFNLVSPKDCRPGSNRNAHWRCKVCANEWWASIQHRAAGRGCRVCIKGQLHSSGKNSMFNTHPEMASELMPNPHGTAKSLVAGTSHTLPWKCSKCDNEWETTGNNRVRGTGCSYCNTGTLHSDKRNSMSKTHPHLADELMPNEYGSPETLIAGTYHTLPWKCSKCNNEWTAVGYSRKAGTGCPACSNKAIHVDGRNSMAITHPDLADELMPNEYGSPETLIAGTNYNLPWKCKECNHEWETTGNNRVSGTGTNCPACVNQELHIDGLNSIASKLPEIAHELLPNPYGTAKTLIYVSGIYLPWKCSDCGHEWLGPARNRARGSGCGPCNSGGLRSDGSNSLAVTNPELAKELLPNEFGTAKTLIAGTNKVLPWRCSTCGYEWKTTGAHRSGGSTGCPKCANYGFQPHLPAQYYVHEILNKFGDVVFYKGGISGDWFDRMRSLKYGLPAHLSLNNIEVLYFSFGYDARNFEKELLGTADIRAPQRKFDGGSELFIQNPIVYARENSLLDTDQLIG
ncbi:MAG: zinc-ribbon domain-containing protein [Candidatus Thermoplasmatota archaeon]|nr:zinc-ribbon domain-containing protein [Candidatus Thermoplasmatota archaeon]